MSGTNHTTHPENVHIGPARLAFYDEYNDHVLIPGKVENIIFTKLDAVMVFQQDVIRGRQVEAQAKATEDKYRLLGKFVEVTDPNTLVFFMKNCGVVTVDDTCGIRTTTEEYIVYDDRCFILAHDNGFYGEGALPAPAGVAASAFTGPVSTINNRTYHIVVTAMYGETEGAYATDSVVVGVGESVLVQITPPATATAESYKIYEYYDGVETRPDARLLLETDSLNVVFTEFTDEGDYPGDATGSFIMTDLNDVAYSAGTDYTVDTTCGLICIVETGSIALGDRVRITYSYRYNQNVEMSIGPAVRNPKVLHPIIMSFKDDDRQIINPRGIEIELWNVLGEGGWSVDLSALNFDSGFEFNWPVLISNLTLNHGKITTYNRHYESYDILDWSTLTQAADSCGEGS